MRLATAVAIVAAIGMAGCGGRRSAPVIHSMSPLAGPPGTVIALGGDSLSGSVRATIGGVVARLTQHGSSEVLVAVPLGAKSGPVALVTSHGTTATSLTFTVQGAPLPGAANPPRLLPTVTGVDPTSVVPGMIVHIRGVDLEGVRRVTIGGASAPFATGKATVSAVVPPRARSGIVVLYFGRWSTAYKGLVVVH